MGTHLRKDSPSWARVGGWRTGVNSHSLVIVMGVIFVLSWAAQALASVVACNELRLRDRLRRLSLGQYLAEPDFWGRTLQNWQSELLAIGSMAVFVVFLHERGSPESKPVGTPHDETPG